MRKTLLLSAMTIGVVALGQSNPIITKWETSGTADKQIAINNRGTATFTYEKVGNPSISGSGVLQDEIKTLIDLPSSGAYIVKITPTSDNFALLIGQTQESEAAELKELLQWGNHRWGSTVSRMFHNCINLVITATDLPDFSGVTDMANMFNNCTSIVEIPNINQWNVSNVRDMSGMFNGAYRFNSDISAWDTGNVKIMGLMFASSSPNNGQFNQNIGQWNTSNVEHMERMFRDNTAFNQDLSKWNTSNVIKFYEMFSGAAAFNQDLSHFDISKTNDIENFLDDSGMSCDNYTKLLKAWATNANTPSGLKFSAKGVKYGDAGKNYRNQLLTDKGWQILAGKEDVYDASCTAGLSVKEVKATDFKITNPVKDILKIQTSENILKTEIYSIDGRFIKAFTGKETNVASLAKGVYILNISTPRGHSSVKIIKE